MHVLHQLKQWAAIATDYNDRESHFLAWHPEVEHRIAKGTLQTNEELDRILDSPWPRMAPSSPSDENDVGELDEAGGSADDDQEWDEEELFGGL